MGETIPTVSPEISPVTLTLEIPRQEPLPPNEIAALGAVVRTRIRKTDEQQGTTLEADAQRMIDALVEESRREYPVDPRDLVVRAKTARAYWAGRGAAATSE